MGLDLFQSSGQVRHSQCTLSGDVSRINLFHQLVDFLQDEMKIPDNPKRIEVIEHVTCHAKMISPVDEPV